MSVEPIPRESADLQAASEKLAELEELLEERDLEIANLRRLARCAIQILAEITGDAG